MLGRLLECLPTEAPTPENVAPSSWAAELTMNSAPSSFTSSFNYK